LALLKHSLFYYGHKITASNNTLNFKEGVGPELTATIPVGSYTLSRFVEKVVAALNTASALNWTYSLNRSTRVVTLIASGTASILFQTGTSVETSCAALLGFNPLDKNNLLNFVGDFGSGSEWAPQFPLQDYKGKDFNKRLVNAVVNKSATGDSVSIQSFGVDRLIKCNAKYINNYTGFGVMREDPSAVESALSFMDYAVEKNPMEFMEDASTPSIFDKIYLESTGQGSDGTSYELTENLTQNLPGFYETGLLTFKVINLE